MKTISKLFIAALATTAMTACNNELSNGSLNNDGTVNFTMGIGETASSRISMEDGTYTATFSPNNAVGIFVEGQESYKNLEYKTEDGKTWKGGPINLPEGGTYTYYAYYPYSSEVNAANAIAISVAADQEAGGYLANDYLYCKKTSGETDVTLEYKHALSLVDVTLAGDAIGDDAVVSIINVATDATLDVTAPSVATGSTLADVNMDVLTNTKNFRAIIPAQTINASTPIFRIETKGKTYEAKYNGEIDFAQGKYLALTITIGEEGGTPEVEITTSASINDWTEGSIAGGDITVEEVPIILPLGEALTDVKGAPTSLTKDAWFGLKQNDTTPGVEYSIQDDDLTNWGKAICLKYTSTWDNDFDNGTNSDGTQKPAGKKFTDSWYVGTIGYYHYIIGAPMNQSIYKVTLKIKGKADSQYSETSKLVFTCRNANNNASFAISTSTNEDTFTATTVSKTPASPDTWEDLTLYINFAKKSTDAPGSKVNIIDTVADDLTKFDLRVYTNNPVKTTPEGEDLSNTATIYIADVVMEPYTGE